MWTATPRYCPLAAYLCSYGYCVELSLRPGVQHSAKHTDDDLRRIVPLAQWLSAAGPKAPLLARLDSGLDSAALMICIESMNRPDVPQVDWIIEWNPRSTDAAQMAAELDAAGAAWEHPRPGKRVAISEQAVEVAGVQRPVRRVLRLIERTIGSRGQHLNLPEYELDGWTTLPAHIDAQLLIALYADHGIKTVMQELIRRAGRLIEHGRQMVLGPGANDRAATVFMRPHAQFAATA